MSSKSKRKNDVPKVKFVRAKIDERDREVLYEAIEKEGFSNFTEWFEYHARHVVAKHAPKHVWVQRKQGRRTDLEGMDDE